jgi:hypothetical protein
MTKKLEETLNLPSLEEALAKAKQSQIDEAEKEILENKKELDEIASESPETASSFLEAMEKSKKIEQKLADHEGLELHDKDMDSVYDESMKSYKDLMDLGMNSSPAHSGKIFETAAVLLRLAMDAKNNKSDKKLRVWKLQLDQARLFKDMEKNNPSPITIDSEDVLPLDRNELLRQLNDLKNSPAESENDK